jgi:hypothetical protein
MDGLSARASVTEGLGLIRRRPGLLIVWALLDLAVAILNAAANALQKNLIAVAAMDLVAIGISVVVWTSAYRALLHPDNRGRMTLGRAEWCVLWARLVPQLILAAPLLLLVPLRLYLPPQSAPVLDVLLLAIAVGTGFWSAVSGVWAFDRLQIAPFRSWRLAEGRLWKLTAVFVAGALAVRGVRWAVRFAAVLLNHHTPLGRITVSEMGSLPVLVFTVASAVISALEVAVLAGIVAAAYRAHAAACAPPQASGGLAGA